MGAFLLREYLDPDTRNFSLAHSSPSGKKHALTLLQQKNLCQCLLLSISWACAVDLRVRFRCVVYVVEITKSHLLCHPFPSSPPPPPLHPSPSPSPLSCPPSVLLITSDVRKHCTQSRVIDAFGALKEQKESGTCCFSCLPLTNLCLAMVVCLLSAYLSAYCIS